MTAENDRLMGYLGADEAVCDRPGWPNGENPAQRSVPSVDGYPKMIAWPTPDALHVLEEAGRL